MNNSFPAVEINPLVRYLGSLIRVEDRPVFKPTLYLEDEDLKDKTLLSVYQAIKQLTTAGIDTTIDNLADELLVMQLAGIQYSTVEEEQIARDGAKAYLQQIAERGAKTKQEFARIESALHEFVIKQGVRHIVKMVEAMDAKAVAPTAQLKKITAYVDNLWGKPTTEDVFMGWQDQARLFNNLPEQQRALIGKPLFIFPPAWNLTRMIPRIPEGFIVTISGGTSNGKSSLAHQWAEWLAATRNNVLMCHLEDTPEQVLFRQTCRHFEGTSMAELERGDKREMMQKMLAEREHWNENGGGIDYMYIPDLPPSYMIRIINDRMMEAKAQGKPYSMVFVDYVQLINFEAEVKAGITKADVIKTFGARFKAMILRHKSRGCYVSQVTQDRLNGDVSTKDGKVFAEQSQVWVNIWRELIKTEGNIEKVVLGNGRERTLSGIGSRSIIGKLEVRKATGGALGIQNFFFNWQRYSGYAQEWLDDIAMNPSHEFDVPVLQPVTDELIQQGKTLAEAFRASYTQLRPG